MVVVLLKRDAAIIVWHIMLENNYYFDGGLLFMHKLVLCNDVTVQNNFF